MNPDLSLFVRDALARGTSRDDIRRVLAEAGWRDEEIAAELDRWADLAFPVPVPRRKPRVSAREAFLHLVLFATLYLAAFNTGAILFDLIERALPDPVTARPWERSEGRLPWALASLLVALPVFLYTHRIIAGSLRRDPEKRGSGVRRWLTYLTLFVTALVIIGDLVAALNGWFRGGLTPRFLLKALVVFAIAAVAFRHYLADLRRDEVDRPVLRTSWLGRAGVIGMAIVAIVGLIAMGAPHTARLRELDRRRVEDLDQLAGAIIAYHGHNGRLPRNLDEVIIDPSARDRRLTGRDPVSGTAYGYVVIDSIWFELCATFSTADSLGPYGMPVGAFWRHADGRHCYRFHAQRGSSPRKSVPD
jgi:hypothetical protein